MTIANYIFSSIITATLIVSLMLWIPTFKHSVVTVEQKKVRSTALFAITFFTIFSWALTLCAPQSWVSLCVSAGIAIWGLAMVGATSHYAQSILDQDSYVIIGKLPVLYKDESLIYNLHQVEYLKEEDKIPADFTLKETI